MGIEYIQEDTQEMSNSGWLWGGWLGQEQTVFPPVHLFALIEPLELCL